ncbi:MAG: HK97 family phage prohead protease [Marinilabiliaceae bacterium]|nr:HK97 family phage prohead protease [Marinilabiliaceae bacterium]
MKRVRITNDSVNSHGCRILTEGMDIQQYMRNPIVLYMHDRGQVIGTMTDIAVGDNEITGVPEFDMVTDLSKQVAEQWDKGSLRMVSVGIECLEWSDDPEYIVFGQTRPTVTKSKLIEVSIVDVGANDDAIQLMKDGKRLNLTEGGDSVLPLLSTIKDMEENKKLQEKVETLSKENAHLKEELEKMGLQLAEASKKSIETLVESAISEGRITAVDKEHFVSLGMAVGADSLKKTLSMMSKRTTLSSLVQGEHMLNKTWDEYDRDGTLGALKMENPEEYKRLFEEKFHKH